MDRNISHARNLERVELTAPAAIAFGDKRLASCGRAARLLSSTALGRFDLDPIFAWIESSALSEWIRGSECICAFPAIVTLHNIGLAFLAGGGIVIDLRLIGFASDMPLKPMARFAPVLWLALALNAITGILLLIAYPTKALTNPLFYIKLLLVALAVGLVYRIVADILRAPDIDRRPLAARAKALAMVSLATWVALIAAGRFLAYTHRWEMLGVPAVL
jgi:hypothetical protein